MRDANLPWQFVVLGFYGFVAIFAVMLSVFSFMPSMEMSAYTQRIVLWVAVPYLAIGLGAMPYLIRGGRRKFGDLNPTNDRGEHPTPAISRSKRLAVSSITLGAGLLMTLVSYSQVNPVRGGHFTVYTGLIGIGLVGVVSALLAPE